MMRTPESLAVSLLAYNEGGGIYHNGAVALDALGGLGFDHHRLVIINDGSTDDTAAEADRLRRDNPGRVQVVEHEVNGGYGRALRTGLEAGLEAGFDLMATLDGDGQFDPTELSRLVATMQTSRADGVIGVRENRQDKLHRLMLGKAWHKLSGSVLGSGSVVSDIDCGMKLFSSPLLETVVPQLISTIGAAISPEIVSRGVRAGFSFSEVGVTHLPRTLGEPTGAKPSVMFKSLQELVAVRRDMEHTDATREPLGSQLFRAIAVEESQRL